MSVYVHVVPGRLRVKCAELKREINKSRVLQLRLKGMVGVQSVGLNSVTGSLLVHYDHEIVRSEAILANVSSELGVHIDRLGTGEDLVENAMSRVGEKVSKALLMLALDRALEGSPFAILTALI